jgi:hypothetical protein
MATTVTPKQSKWSDTRVLLGIIIVILVLALVFIGGIATGRIADNSNNQPGPAHMGMRHVGQGHGGLHGLLGDSQNVVSGAITNISGNSFTVAGGGTTTQVTTSSSTQYKGASSVKVNDTVIAIGNKNGDTLQADRVVVNPLKGF